MEEITLAYNIRHKSALAFSRAVRLAQRGVKMVLSQLILNTISKKYW